MSVYNCSCGVEATFFCAEDQASLCLSHRLHHQKGHTLYFNQSSITRSQKAELITELKNLQKSCEASAHELQELLEELYSEINKIFQKEHQKIMNSLNSVKKLLEKIESQENFTQAFDIFSKLQQNPKLLIESLKHRVKLFVNKRILRSIQKVVKFSSNVEELIDDSPFVEPPSDQWKAETETRYMVKKTMNSFQLANDEGQLAEWIQSVSVQRNLDQFKTLSILGDSIDDNAIEGYSLLPSAFFIKELGLIEFESHDLEQFSKRVLPKCRHLNKVMFVDCDISQQSVDVIKKSLMASQELKEIVFNKCQNGDILCQIPSCLDLRHLMTLALSAAMIGDEGIESLAVQFPKMTSLKYLYLDSNSFSTQGSVYLVIYLPFLQDLAEINLSSNKIGGCLGSILKSLSKIKHIKNLNISSTEPEESQLELIKSSLQNFQYLESIFFDMTTQEGLLTEIRSILPSYTHIYKENSEMSFEFK